MEIPRPSDAQKDAFRALVPDAPGVTVRAMFANLAAFIHGNMFMALFGDRVAFRLAEQDREAALARPDGEPFAPGGRTMREYVSLPLGADVAEETFQALDFVGAMPPKQPKARKQPRG